MGTLICKGHVEYLPSEGKNKEMERNPRLESCEAIAQELKNPSKRKEKIRIGRYLLGWAI